MYLELKEVGHKKKVFLHREPPFFLSISNSRVSPIFPIGCVHIENLPTESFICFCFLRNPQSAIGRLIAILNNDDKKGELWFSHGLASLIIISSIKDNVDNCLNILKDSLSAYEIWTVCDSNVIDIILSYPTETPPDIEFPDICGLDPDVQALLHEYYFCITSLLSRAAQYHPQLVNTLLGLHDETLNIIRNINFITIDNSVRPELCQFDEISLSEIKTEKTSKIKNIQFLLDQILSLNASLSYAITQGFSGVVPIFEHESPIRSFSLLGVGTAFVALTKIYESVNNVFSKYPIARLILENFETDFTYIPIFLNMFHYNVDEWGKHSGIVDKKLEKFNSSEVDKMCHISYFSARFGFRETMNSISAAIQSLSCGATVRWSVLTLTHEFLHAHVRAIMAIIGMESNDGSFNDLFQDFITIDTPDEKLNNINLRKRLAFIVLACCEAISNAKRTAPSILNSENAFNRRQNFTKDEYFKLLKEYYKDINEYIVHTLDFLYFYEADSELYIKVIWLTWSTIPEIQKRLSHYLLRTLLAISVRLKGNSTERFNAATKKLAKSFSELLHSDACEFSYIIIQAQSILNDQKKCSVLKFEFCGAIRLADMTHSFLHSSFVQRDIKADDLQIVDQITYYPIETGEFSDQDIQSPIAFLVDRTRRRLTVKPELNFERLLSTTCWEFLVLSSANV